MLQPEGSDLQVPPEEHREEQCCSSRLPLPSLGGDVAVPGQKVGAQSTVAMEVQTPSLLRQSHSLSCPSPPESAATGEERRGLRPGSSFVRAGQFTAGFSPSQMCNAAGPSGRWLCDAQPVAPQGKSSDDFRVKQLRALPGLGFTGAAVLQCVCLDYTVKGLIGLTINSWIPVKRVFSWPKRELRATSAAPVGPSV